MTRKMAEPVSPWADWPLNREVVMSRVVDADRETAFNAWIDPGQIVEWFGHSGFRITTHQIEIREGGLWRFDMIAPDGAVFSNRMEFLRVEPLRLIEFIHGEDIGNDPDAFRMLVTFDDQDNGKTAVTLRQMHPTAERRTIVIGFGAIEYGAQIWDNFAEFAAKKRAMSAAVGRSERSRFLGSWRGQPSWQTCQSRS